MGNYVQSRIWIGGYADKYAERLVFFSWCVDFVQFRAIYHTARRGRVNQLENNSTISFFVQ